MVAENHVICYSHLNHSVRAQKPDLSPELLDQIYILFVFIICEHSYGNEQYPLHHHGSLLWEMYDMCTVLKEQDKIAYFISKLDFLCVCDVYLVVLLGSLLKRLILWNWSYTQLCAALWMLGMDSRCFGRAVSVYCYWAVSPSSTVLFCRYLLPIVWFLKVEYSWEFLGSSAIHFPKWESCATSQHYSRLILRILLTYFRRASSTFLMLGDY